MSERTTTRHKWLAAGILSAHWFTVSLTAFFPIAIALPNMMASLGSDLLTIQWVITANFIGRIVLMPAVGWLSAVAGRRNLLWAAAMGTTAFTLLCALAWNAESLIVFRTFQGFLSMPAQVLAHVMMYETFPEHQRGFAMGLLLLVGAVSALVVYVVGGFLVEEYSWRAIFLMALPTGMLSIVATPLVFTRDACGKVPDADPWGLLTMMVGLVAFLLALSAGPRSGWHSATCVWLLGITFIGVVLFVLAERRARAPVVDLRLYRNMRFTAAASVTLLFMMGYAGTQVVFPLMLQQSHGHTPGHAGLILAPGALAMGITGVMSGSLSDRTDGRFNILVGLTTFAVCSYACLYVAPEATVGWAALFLGSRAAFGFVSSPLHRFVLSVLPAGQRDLGGGLDALHGSVAYSIGIALTSVIYDWRHHMYLRGMDESGPGGRIAALPAFQDTLLFSGILFLAAMLPLIWVRPPPDQKAGSHAVHGAAGRP
jgi:EmrB/QacA subfamily drug resistance transporter